MLQVLWMASLWLAKWWMTSAAFHEYIFCNVYIVIYAGNVNTWYLYMHVVHFSCMWIWYLNHVVRVKVIMLIYLYII